MVRVNRYILAFCLSALCAVSAQASLYDDCSILFRTDSEIQFVYRVGASAWARNAQGAYLEIANAALDARPGMPQVPGRIIYLALPPGTDNVDATLLNTGTSLRLTPPQPLSLDAPAWPYPDTRLVVDDLFTLHGVRLARLILHPALYADPQGALDLADAMTVSVRFSGGSYSGAPLPSRDPYAAILGQLLLNPDDARVDAERNLAKPAVETNPFAGGAQWVSLRTRGDGLFVITPSALRIAGVSLNGVNPAAMRLFAGPGRQLSAKVADPAPTLSEAAMLWQGDDDAAFEDGEQFLFWGDGLNRWEVDSLGNLVDVVHRYDRDNVYWLALSHSASSPPLRVESLSAPPTPGALDQFTGIVRARHEEDTILRIASSGFIESYYTRYFRNRRVGAITFYEARNAASGLPARIDMGTWAGFAADYHPRLRIAGLTVFPDIVAERKGEDRSTLSTFRLPAYDPNVDYELFFDAANTTSYYLDFYTIEYHRRLEMAAGAFKFAAPDTTAALNFTIAGGASAQIWDISDPRRPRAITDAGRDGSDARFGVSLVKGQRRVFYVFVNSSLKSPQTVAPVNVVDLHTPSTGADYLAIGPRAFGDATADFLDYRAGTDNLVTRYIAVEDIYNSFALGPQDPIAIRRFLRHTHYHWPGQQPVYALLVGDGTNDYLNNTRANSVNYVPPYIVRDDAVVSDESYVYFTDRAVLDAEGDTQANPFPDMLIGRWPVRNAGEIAAITAKIKRYESAENLGPWRSRVMMVADDEYGERDNLSVCEGFHIRDAEAIANAYIPARVDVQKIYLTEYPFDNPSCVDPAATGCRKPAAKEAVVAGLNEGVLVFDFLGHGNPDVMAHERVFERTVDLPRLTNGSTPHAVLTFSCSIGFFDDPVDEGMSEEWIRMPEGGAVAVVSATRLSGALANADLNEVVFDLLFKRGLTGIAAALYTGKLTRQYFELNCRLFENCDTPPCPCANDRGYILFGDPALKLGLPTRRVNFAALSPDSLTALEPAAVTGTVTDADGNLLAGFNGAMSVTVRDVPRRRHYTYCTDDTINYQLAGGTLYRGQVPVQDGRFEFSFIVPKDIAYGQTGARIMGHAVAAAEVAGGALDSIPLAVSAGAINDTAGPAVVLRTDKGEAVVDGFHLPEDATLEVAVDDPSGVNLTGSSGHRFVVFVDEDQTPFADLTDLFVYDPGSPNRGKAQFSIAGLSQGAHRLQVKVWDNANNSTASDIDIQVVAKETDIDFRLTEFLNHPNPLSDMTTFYFRATRAISSARIRLFTLAGRLIWEADAQDGLTSWDGRDNTGDRVANGVYLAQLEATGQVLADDGQIVDKKAYREMKVVVSR
jgi:hypothetical protein